MIQEVIIKKHCFGVLLLKIARKCLLQDIFSSLTYCDWLNLTETVLNFVYKLKNNKQAFLNINPWSLMRSPEGEFKLLDA
jgi:hypothetical protein